MIRDHILQTVDNNSIPNEIIHAIGNDIVFLPEFAKSFNDKSIKRSYTANEIKYCQQFSDPILRYASTWAAKESVYKAVKQIQPETPIWWKSIEIVRDKPSGKPNVFLKEMENNYKINLTISHDGEYVWALALVRSKI